MAIVGWLRALFVGLLLTVLAAAPADARRFRFGGLGGTGSNEQIERVADLPDRDPYLHDGVAWDLGWFYSGYKVAGVTTSSHYDQGKFVLYNGDRYVRLDDERLALIALELGYDPTSAFRAERAAKNAERDAAAAKEGESLKDNLIERLPGETTAAYHARARRMAAERSAALPAASGHRSNSVGSGIGSAFMGLLFMIAVVVWLARTLSRRNRRAVLTRSAEGRSDPGLPSFDERVAARLRELEAGATLAPAVAAPMPAMAAPAMAAPVPAGVPRPGVRTFGRRAT